MYNKNIYNEKECLSYNSFYEYIFEEYMEWFFEFFEN